MKGKKTKGKKDQKVVEKKIEGCIRLIPIAVTTVSTRDEDLRVYGPGTPQFEAAARQIKEEEEQLNGLIKKQGYLKLVIHETPYTSVAEALDKKEDDEDGES